jgi:hypothetical protein
MKSYIIHIFIQILMFLIIMGLSADTYTVHPSDFYGNLKATQEKSRIRN